MKCPGCGAWSDVKETRAGPTGTRRRRECANGHRFSTQELLVGSERDVLRPYAVADLKAGLSSRAAAAKYGIPARTILRWSKS